MENSENLDTESNKTVDNENRKIEEYHKIESRLKEIEEEVKDENIDLDKSLKLYEEAVNLGVKASKTVENNVLSSLNKPDDSQNLDTSEENDETVDSSNQQQ